MFIKRINDFSTDIKSNTTKKNLFHNQRPKQLSQHPVPQLKKHTTASTAGTLSQNH